MTGEIQSVGDQPLRDVIDSLGGWPVLEPDWLMSRSDWTLEKMLGRLRGRHETQVLVVMWVAADDKNSSANVIQVMITNMMLRFFVFGT
jgi:neprilysin